VEAASAEAGAGAAAMEVEAAGRTRRGVLFGRT